VTAVVGNTDGFELRARVGEVAELELAGQRVVVAHGHQLGSPTPQALRRAHSAADIIVYGHTHRPLVDEDGSTLVVNPGAAGAARFGIAPSIGLLLRGWRLVDPFGLHRFRRVHVRRGAVQRLYADALEHDGQAEGRLHPDLPGDVVRLLRLRTSEAALLRPLDQVLPPLLAARGDPGGLLDQAGQTGVQLFGLPAPA